MVRITTVLVLNCKQKITEKKLCIAIDVFFILFSDAFTSVSVT